MKIGQLIMMGLKGSFLDPIERFLIEKEDIGSVLLFKRNIASYETLKNLILELRSLRTSSPLIIAVDREGGPVDRLKHLKEVCPWPNPSLLSKTLRFREIEKTSFFLHQELKDIGINMNLSPCLDILNEKSLVLKGRTVSKNTLKILSTAKAVIQGAKKAQVLSCAKHFPGHGSVQEDSHHTLPVDFRKAQHIHQTALPFKGALAEHVPALMMSHILYPSLDPENPASSSKKIIHYLLKKYMNFKGLILTDDIDMKAFQKPISKTIEKSLEAGIHIFISGQKFETTLQVLEQLKKESCKKDVEQRKKEVLNFKKQYSAFLSKNSCSPAASREWFEKIQKKF